MSHQSTQGPPGHVIPLPAAFAILVVIHVGALVLMGRDWTGGCTGIIQWNPEPACNSRYPLDAYSLLHLGFGLGLSALFSRMRPHWSVGNILLLVVFSSTLWEVIENLPFMVSMFGYDSQPELEYSGDSILNSMGDTVATFLGGLIARGLPLSITVIAIVVIEIGVSLSLGDGYLMGFMRIFGDG